MPGVPLSTALIRRCSNHRHENLALAQLHCLYHRGKGMAMRHRPDGEKEIEREKGENKEREGDHNQPGRRVIGERKR